MKSTCLVHDWLITMRGGEKVLEGLTELFPEAPIYTLFAIRKNLSPRLRMRKIRTSFLQCIPGINKFYRWLLPIFPFAIRSLNLKKYDLIISSSHCVAKAVRVRKGAIHICYCHTPMRYLWGFEEEYFGNFPKWIRHLIKSYFSFLKRWDVKTSRLITAFIANSANTAEKIRNLYGKDASIVYPPVDLPNEIKVDFEPKSGGYFLMVSALVPYKRVDLAIEAFNRLRRPLKIVGDGPLMESLKKIAHFEGIHFEGWVSDVWSYYQNCKALIFPGEEDFGIVPLEAQMCGKPVIAYGRGGACETVIPYDASLAKERKYTGIFFDKPDVKSLIYCVQKSEHLNFDPDFIRSHALRFSQGRFKREISNLLDRLSKEKKREFSVSF